ncbi:fasciclin domain-containing protein [Methanoculleus sp. YWC-01]|uniref:Fasciclin domain-containing protein n=1 Tax=Methanoculleus nereidis TaxID=2735141 RepID=A0ABU3Z394_9EURY|nr:fasciclin domain-containing protein [Methanoculleus sp. YWC-01]MDV4343277.1 fasciclin domain-containing protein [Methanoculleus sp. YWC-01]
MQTNYVLIITVLAIGATVLICGCMGLPGDGDQNRTNETPAVENLTADEVLARDGNFSVFIHALDTAGLKGTLAGAGPYTIFAPTDEAFNRLSETVTEELFDDPKGNLAETLLYHMAPGRYAAAEIAANDTVPTVQGNPVSVDAAGGNVAVNGARVTRADIPAANGVIHAIDAVMIPPDVILPPANETVENVTANTTG